MVYVARFNLQGTAKARLGLLPQRSLANILQLLNGIGQHCVDNMTDGVFTLADVLRLPLCVQRRTVVNAHVPALLACGAFVKIDDGRFAIAGFHEFNLPAEKQMEILERRRAYGRDWKRNDRHKKKLALIAQSVQARPEKNPMISGAEDECPSQTTQSTPPGRVRSAINGVSPCATGAPEVDSPGEADYQALQEEIASSGDPGWGDLLKDTDLDAVDAELATNGSKNAKGTVSPQKTPESATLKSQKAAGKFLTRVARMPKTKSPIYLHDVQTDMKDAMGYLPSFGTVKGFWDHMTLIGACREEMGYAAREVKRQKAKGNIIYSPLACMTAIVVKQKQARLGLTV